MPGCGRADMRRADLRQVKVLRDDPNSRELAWRKQQREQAEVKNI
jgi:hypothetical protein